MTTRSNKMTEKSYDYKPKFNYSIRYESIAITKEGNKVYSISVTRLHENYLEFIGNAKTLDQAIKLIKKYEEE